MALECLLKDDHVFEYDQLSDAIRCDDSLIIGLLQVTEYAENLRPAGLVSFIHKSIQEFLAAWYVSYRCLPEGNLGEIEQHARTVEECEAVENVFQFVCGLSDEGAMKVYEHLKSVRISDPTLDVSKTIPDVETDTGVSLCEVTDRHERFSNLIHDSFREVQSKAELLSHYLDCTGGVILVTGNTPLSELKQNVDVLIKLAHDCVFRFIDDVLEYLDFPFLYKVCVEDLVLYKSLDFLNCSKMPLRVTESSEVLTVDDFIRKFSFERLDRSLIGSILCFRNGQFQFYITKLLLKCDAHARLFTGSTTISDPSDAPSLCSEHSCLKFLSSLRCDDLSSQTVNGLGAVIGNCKHLRRIEVVGLGDSVYYLLKQVQNPSKCSVAIELSRIGAHLTSAGAVQLASLLPRFNNVITLGLDLRNDYSAAALDTLVTSITCKTLKKLRLWVESLTPAATNTFGRSLSEMSSLEEFELTGFDGSVLQAKEMEVMFGGFNKTLPLHTVICRGFSARGSLAPLFISLLFFPNLVMLELQKLNMDEHDFRGLLKSFQFIPNLQRLDLSDNPLGQAVRSIVPRVTKFKKLQFLSIDNTSHSGQDLIYVRDTVYKALPTLEVIPDITHGELQFYLDMTDDDDDDNDDDDVG